MPHMLANGVSLAFEAIGKASRCCSCTGPSSPRPSGIRRTTGWSTHPYSVAFFASDVIGLLDALGAEAVACCGHSLGGLIAQELALADPGRLRAFVLAETSLGTASTRADQ
jgi:pimeloyl-ACP methyl ester carboxylesterase